MFSKATFDLPIERIIAWGRLFLSLFCSIAVSANAAEFELDLTTRILLAYTVFSLVWVFILILRPDRPHEAFVVHAIDISISSVLIYISAGTASPFFVFFTFTLLAATLRWDWRGAIMTASILTFVLLCLYFLQIVSFGGDEEEADIGRTIIRGGFLMVCGLMLAYVGAYRERAQRRFAELAAWPSSAVRDERNPLEISLMHVAAVMGASRVLVIWDQNDEPFRHVAFWSEGSFQYSQERGDLFSQVVDSSLRDKPFVIDSDRSARRDQSERARTLLDRDLQRAFDIRSAVTAPFKTRSTSGRIFVMNRAFESDEDVPLLTIVASRVGDELEERSLRNELAASAIAHERTRLGRDLHDGVLQGLAAASLHLKSISISLPDAAQQKLIAIRHMLADEAQRIRAFVEDSRSTNLPTTGAVALRDELENRVEKLREQWECSITLSIEPPDLMTSFSTARALRHMLGEAVSNAVRHGRASHVDIAVTIEAETLRVSVQDNGNGFDNLSGSFALGSEGKPVTPFSLRTRAEDLGGTLFVTSSAQGANLTFQLPR